MKKIIFLLLLLPAALLASKILSYNIYERTDRADIMITFDTPYSGIIKQSKGDFKTILKLEDASIESSKIKKVNSEFLRSIAITPLQGYVQITAVTPKTTKLQVSKTADAYGLRLRFTKNTPSKNSTVSKTESTATLSNLPTKKEGDLTTSYYIVVTILIVGILILFYIKRKMHPNHTAKRQSSWLFNAPETLKEQSKQKQNFQKSFQHETPQELTIRFQKKLDDVNSVVMLDYMEQSYLLLVGNGNLLLDKFIDNKPTTQQEFEAILQDRQDELENFLAHPKHTSNEHFQTHEDISLQAYKERAASLAYGE